MPPKNYWKSRKATLNVPPGHCLRYNSSGIDHPELSKVRTGGSLALLLALVVPFLSGKATTAEQQSSCLREAFMRSLGAGQDNARDSQVKECFLGQTAMI